MPRRFGGGPAVSAVFLGDTKLRCMIAPGLSGNLSVDVGYNNDTLTATGLAVTLEPAALVDAVYPLVAGAAGGTTLTVQGRNFRGNVDAACVFGDVETVATLVSNNTITCGVPYTRRPGVVSFSVLISDVEIRQPDVTFRYVPQPEISGVSPEFGPESGNTLVTVFGAHLTGFYADCLFASAPPVPG